MLNKLNRLRKRKTTQIYIATKCGHPTVQAGDVTAFGVTIQTQMPLVRDEVEYCLACILGMAIRCAWCKLPIFIGDPITLYTPREADFKVPEHAVVYSLEPLRLVGCLRWDCAQTGADRAGFWLPDSTGKGHVQRTPSLFEQALEGCGVIVEDLWDIAETSRLRPPRDSRGRG